MRNLIILPLLLFAICTSNAQDSLRAARENSNAEHVAYVLRMLEHELSITKQQQLQVKKLLTARLNERGKLSKADQSKFKLANENTLDKLQKILTRVQYEQYLQLKEEKRQQRAKYLHDHPDYKFSEEDELLDF